MKKVTINSDKPYHVLLDSSIINNCRNIIEEYLEIDNKTNFFIITDDIVDSLHGNKLYLSFDTDYKENENEIGKVLKLKENIFKFVIKNGEESKSLEIYSKIMESLSTSGMHRNDVIIAFGGGVVGDLAGFCAATYMRGIRYIQIPTTLLSMVDSSVGGKTAINLSSGKNLVGSFYQPSLVIIDTLCLCTLPQRDFSSGMAEVIKYAILESDELFRLLENADIITEEKNIPYRLSLMENIIERCIVYKDFYVSEDEKDNGVRQKLNLGHTFGHAIEILSGYEYTHGESVSIGIALISRYSYLCGIMPFSEYVRIIKLLDRFFLPVFCKFSTEDMIKIINRDKKVFSDRINLIIPEKIGCCFIKNLETRELLKLNSNFHNSVKKCGLIGKKLSHSLSPEIHKELGDYEYRLYEIDEKDINNFFISFPLDACNVTIPYKKKVSFYMKEYSESAKEMNSFNVVLKMPKKFAENHSEKLYGDNTDIYGFEMTVKKLKLDIEGKKVLILGSGGASNMVQYYMLKKMAREIITISRTGKDNYYNIHNHYDADIIVNTTPVGMYPNIGKSPINIDSFKNVEAVIDLIYNPEKTKLLQDAEKLGIKCSNGFEMLYYQARLASLIFKLFE